MFAAPTWLGKAVGIRGYLALEMEKPRVDCPTDTRVLSKPVLREELEQSLKMSPPTGFLPLAGILPLSDNRYKSKKLSTRATPIGGKIKNAWQRTVGSLHGLPRCRSYFDIEAAAFMQVRNLSTLQVGLL